ncbi:Smr/MutS family protein [Tsuneonella sp. YG55]|uniref:Smr/MutS family protein n=1 Tax=Tsuneonella litorea TaxID=2976475 RepID=A0A9X2W1G6_9SPHN|nr:Smr/MutS family protein [Tsuneonella litorea]MCT2559287.1 Smr/MutS family protein [Tsuneonella litorea]
MKPPRGLSAEEADAWARVAATVAPLRPVRGPTAAIAAPPPAAPSASSKPPAAPWPQPRKASAAAPRTAPPKSQPERAPATLDSHWDRRFRAGAIEPDLTLDLHGHTLDTAYTRLMDGIAQARAMDARVVLLIAGRSRPVEHADRAGRRGAIRAKVLDWLAASRHAPAIAAIRKAHPRHGGDGALYIVLRRAR